MPSIFWKLPNWTIPWLSTPEPPQSCGGFFCYLRVSTDHKRLPRRLSGEESTCQCRSHRRCGFKPWVREDPLQEEMATHPSILAWKIHGQRSLMGYSPWNGKQLVTTEHAHTHALIMWNFGLYTIGLSLSPSSYFNPWLFHLLWLMYHSGDERWTHTGITQRAEMQSGTPCPEILT